MVENMWSLHKVQFSTGRKKNGKAKSGNQTNTHTVIKECRVNG